MFIPDSLKLNKFQVVNIPSGKEIFTRLGFVTGRSYSGDEVAPQSMNKIDVAMHFDMLNNNMVSAEEKENLKIDVTK